jgi:hypothetical protein
MPPTFVPKSKLSDAPVQDYGAMQAFALGATTAQILVPPLMTAFQTQERAAFNIVVHAAGSGIFHLNYEFSTDQGTTWYVGKQVVSATVVVDGDTATYTQAADFDISVGYWWRVSLYNTTGGSINVVAEWRYYSSGG